MENKERELLIEVGKRILDAGKEILPTILPESTKKDLRDLDMVVTYLQCGLHVPDHLEPALDRLKRTAVEDPKDHSVTVFKTYDAEAKESVISVLNMIMANEDSSSPFRSIIESIVAKVEAWESGSFSLEGTEVVVFSHITLAITKWSEERGK